MTDNKTVNKQAVNKQDIKDLVTGTVTRETLRRMQRVDPKDSDRFWKYLEVLQEEVSFKEKILLRLTDHLYIVRKEGGGRVVKCDCGHEFGDYRVNWKLNARIYVRRTAEEIGEIYTISSCAPEVGWAEVSEFYCPGCVALLTVEVVAPGCPFSFEFLPDLDTLYRDWMGKPLEDESPDWYQDKTEELVSQWAGREEIVPDLTKALSR